MSKSVKLDADHRITREWQPGAGFEWKRLWRWRALYGELRLYPDKTKTYWAVRDPGGNPQGYHRETNSWALDTFTIIKVLLPLACTRIGILCTNGEEWGPLPILDWRLKENGGKAFILDHSHIRRGFSIGAVGKPGVPQWAIGRELFPVIYPTAAVRASSTEKWLEEIMEEMRGIPA